MRIKYTKELLSEAISKSTSMAGVMRYLGLREAGGTHYHLLLKARRWQLDMSHFTGSGHLKGKHHNWSKRLPLSAYLVVNATCNRNHLKHRLIKEGVLLNKCSICGNSGLWQAKPLVMVLDHINGVRDDNRKENLRLLCPNCNSQTGTFCRRKQHGRVA